MKIALLNLPLDNNYGGNLQRYALLKTLNKLGYEASHLQLRFNYYLPIWKRPYVYTKRFIQKFVLKKNINVFLEKEIKEKYINSLNSILPFYDKNIPHTEPLYSYEDLKKATREFDACIVGSDQVWRKTIAMKYLPLMFLNFVPQSKAKFAYSVSFGSDDDELSEVEKLKCGKLYHDFRAVSVREISGLNLLKTYNWDLPSAIHLLDPTFLISRDEYKELIHKANIDLSSQTGIFCYILDMTEEKRKVIDEMSRKHNLPIQYVSLENTCSVEEWLAAFYKAQFIITDSYHGMVFSIIFHKPYYVFKNEFRGNSRFETLQTVFKLSLSEENPDWNSVNNRIYEEREKSLCFINELKKYKNGI